MSKENQEICWVTATVAIFSPAMIRILLVKNDVVWALMPPGGKQQHIDLWDPCRTALREVVEEVGIDLTKPDIGTWLDAAWEKTSSPTLIQTHTFSMKDKWYIDYLYFFRLSWEHSEEYKAEKIGVFYDKKTVTQLRLENYSILVPGNRAAILRVMRYRPH